MSNQKWLEANGFMRRKETLVPFHISVPDWVREGVVRRVLELKAEGCKLTIQAAVTQSLIDTFSLVKPTDKPRPKCEYCSRVPDSDG